MAEQIQVPDFPEMPTAMGAAPFAVKEQWAKTYAEGIKQARIDAPEDVKAHHQSALKEANRMFRISEPISYKEALAMDDWKLTERMERNGKLVVKTIDGKDYSFAIPGAVSDGPKQKTPKPDPSAQ